MRILHIVGERGFSGGEHQLALLLAHLDAVGVESRLLLQPGALFEDKARELGVPFDSVRMRNGFDPLACMSIRRRLRRQGPDLVHLADARAHKLGALATIGRRPAPLVVTRRVDGPLRAGRLARWLYGRAVQGVVAISRSVREKVLATGVSTERVHLIHDGVEPARYADLAGRRQAARAALGLSADGPVVACAARLGPRKGQIHLVRAFQEVAARIPRAQLLLAGEGSERAVLEMAGREGGLASALHLPGYVDALDVLAAADLVCIPSLREGLSVFALESQAAGLPVVASRTGGLVESVADEESGLLIPPGDEAALASALVALLDDAERRTAMGQAGRRRIERSFTARAMAERTLAVYELLVR